MYNFNHLGDKFTFTPVVYQNDDLSEKIKTKERNKTKELF